MSQENKSSSSVSTNLQSKCPCQAKTCPLGVFTILPKKSKQHIKRHYSLGLGLKTTDPKKAGDILLHRDHKRIVALMQQYQHGKLGVYMVPPMFYGEVPQAIKLSEYKVEKHQDRVKGDIAERKVFYALQEYYRITGDDTLVVHSHKFRVHDESNNEKDFIVLNLTKGKYLAEFLMCLVNTYFSSMLHLLEFRL